MRALFAFALSSGLLGGMASAQAPRGLTAVRGIKVGHFTLTQRPTGCTVVLAERGAIAGVDVRGSAPGTRETRRAFPGTPRLEIWLRAEVRFSAMKGETS